MLSLLRCLLQVQPTNSPLNLVTTRSSFSVEPKRIWKRKYYMKLHVYIWYAYNYTYVIVFFQDVVQLVCSSDVSGISFSFWNEMIHTSIFWFQDFCESMVSSLLRLVVCRSIVNLSKWVYLGFKLFTKTSLITCKANPLIHPRCEDPIDPSGFHGMVSTNHFTLSPTVTTRSSQKRQISWLQIRGFLLKSSKKWWIFW